MANKLQHSNGEKDWRNRNKILKTSHGARPHGLSFTWYGSWGLCLWHKPTELVHSFSFCSCVCFCLYGPFNCISFHSILSTTLRFVTLFFRSYFCLTGPFNYIIIIMSIWKSPSALIQSFVVHSAYNTNWRTDARWLRDKFTAIK